MGELLGKGAFSLLDEPWIDVLTLDGQHEVVSLSGLFRRAPELRRITSRYPSIALSVLRLAEAILLRALNDGRSGAERTALMDALWKGVRAPDDPGAISYPTLAEHVIAYLESHRGGFWLIHPERPFYQIPDIVHSKNPPEPMAALTLDGQEEAAMFRQRSVFADFSLAEAAQWLIHAQMVDAKKNGGYSSTARGAGICYGQKGNARGTQYVQHGPTLRETLLLNFYNDPIVDEVYGSSAEGVLLPWENGSPITETYVKEGVPARSIADRLGRRGRAIRLLFDPATERAVGFYRFYDAFFPPLHGFVGKTAAPEIEPFAAVRDDGKGKVWLAASGTSSSWDTFAALGHDKGMAPAPLVTQTRALTNAGIIPASMRITVEAMGQVYGTNDQRIEATPVRMLKLPAWLLDPSGEETPASHHETAQAISTAGEQAGKIVWLMSQFSGQAAQAEGADAKAAAAVAKETHTRALDAAFKDWLSQIEEPLATPELAAARASWATAAQKTVERAIADALQIASPSAMVGKREAPSIFLAAERLRRSVKTVLSA